MIAQDASLSVDLTAICLILPGSRIPRHCQLFDQCRVFFYINIIVCVSVFQIALQLLL